MFPRAFEDLETSLSHSTPRHRPLMRLSFHVSPGPARSAQLLVPHSRRSFFGLMIRGQNTWRSLLCTGPGLALINLRWLQCTMGRRKAEHRGRGDDGRPTTLAPSLQWPGTILSHGHGPSEAGVQRSEVAALLLCERVVTSRQRRLDMQCKQSPHRKIASPGPSHLMLTL